MTKNDLIKKLEPLTIYIDATDLINDYIRPIENVNQLKIKARKFLKEMRIRHERQEIYSKSD